MLLCNGFMHNQDQECYIFDTPVTDTSTLQLISRLREDRKLKIKGAGCNHFHNNCTEGADFLSSIESLRLYLWELKNEWYRMDVLFRTVIRRSVNHYSKRKKS